MKDLAEYLKSERLSRGLTLSEMSEKVRVSVSMLQTLEEGNYERIGTDLLIRSFIRKYCIPLEIDPQPLIEKYGSQIRAYDQQEASIRRFGKWSKTITKKGRTRIFSMLFVGIAVLGLVYGGVWLWKSREYSDTSQSLRKSGYSQQDLPPDLPGKAGQGPFPEAKREVRTEPDQGFRPSSEMNINKAEMSQPGAPADKPQDSTAGGSRAARTKPGDAPGESGERPVSGGQIAARHQFSVEAVQKTWIQVTADEKEPQNIMLDPGDRREWETGNTMRIVVGNAGGIRMKWDGRPVEVPAKPGSVLRFNLPDQRYVKE